MVNSLYDPAAIVSLLNISCVFYVPSCSADELQQIEDWRTMVVGKLHGVLEAGARHEGHEGHKGSSKLASHGVFASACSQHEEVCRDKDFFGVSVGGVTMGEALWRWIGGAPTLQIDGDTLGHNPTCWQPKPPQTHGEC